MESVLGIARVRGITEFEADVLIAGGAGGASLSILCKALRAEQFPPPGM